ncbi:hypothetical protein Acr_07g0016100 [Actinidia rufa]|uniref:peroxidase n=1 Tax=Actinidia rufa TaxID=165716 RepID=A0A7J0EY78_9ERIC|nr:hypothetical protein Acr_07g0016100 [Actinidia rufa]
MRSNLHLRVQSSFHWLRLSWKAMVAFVDAMLQFCWMLSPPVKKRRKNQHAMVLFWPVSRTTQWQVAAATVLFPEKDDVIPNVASPDSAVRNITELFVRKGLTQEEMVILTSAQSIGIAHCPTFLYRIQGYNETHRIDPKLDAVDASKIISTCQQVSSEKMVEASLKMDNSFYKNLLEGKSLIESDRAMTDDPMTRSIMERMASDEEKWLKMFGRAMARLATVDVKNRTKGEIRKNCRFVNSHKTVVNSGNADASGKASDSSNTSDIGKNLPSSNISSSEVIPSDSIGSAQDFIKSMP